MDRKSQLLFLVLLVAIAGSVFMTYWKTMYEKDFVIINDLEEEEMVSDDMMGEMEELATSTPEYE